MIANVQIVDHTAVYVGQAGYLWIALEQRYPTSPYIAQTGPGHVKRTVKTNSMQWPKTVFWPPQSAQGIAHKTPQ